MFTIRHPKITVRDNAVPEYLKLETTFYINKKMQSCHVISIVNMTSYILLMATPDFTELAG